jgi:hypothetical protein
VSVILELLLMPSVVCLLCGQICPRGKALMVTHLAYHGRSYGRHSLLGTKPPYFYVVDVVVVEAARHETWVTSVQCHLLTGTFKLAVGVPAIPDIKYCIMHTYDRSQSFK